MKTSQLITSPNSDELPYWLALLRAPEIGPVRFLKLHQKFPKISELFSASLDVLSALNLNPNLMSYLANPDWISVEKDIKWAQQSGNFIMTYLDDDYPLLLNETSSAPPLLFIQGNKQLLVSPQIAIVGSRHSSVIGTENAFHFASHLAKQGFTITSGLALGIDAASHRGALASTGKTIAVMGTGLDCIYPKQHRFLASEISHSGALISEFPLGTPVNAKHFPRRNRIISGLSLGVLVVEAAANSGSLITAQLALDQGREVFAMPGSIHNPLSRGCHALLRQGAKLVENAHDIVEELSPLLVASGNLAWLSFENSVTPTQNQNNELFTDDCMLTPATQTVLKASATGLSSQRLSHLAADKDLEHLTKDFQKIIDSIDFAATPIDLIVSRSGLTVSTVSSMLLHLELQDLICAVPGGYVRLPPQKTCF